MKTHIITFLILLFGITIHAQENMECIQDTLVFKTGEIVPCKIISLDHTNNSITVQLCDSSGMLSYEPYSFDEVKTYIFGKIIQSERKPADQYKIELLDGTQLTGKILYEHDSIIVLELVDLGELSLHKSKIDKLIPIDAPSSLKKSLWFSNPHATRLLFAPTAIPLKKGEGYYQNIYIVGNMFNYGVLDNLSIGAGFDFITMFGTPSGEWNPILNFNAKTGFKVHNNVHIGAGAIYVTQLNNFSAGLPYALGTFGSYNSNFTSGVGWGFVDETFEEKPFIMLGGMIRCSEKIWFITENWITPLGENEQYYLAVSYGLRFSGKRMCVDLAFINSKDIIEALIIGIPYVDFVIKFGK